MRTVADLQRHAARVGATLVNAYHDAEGRLVGEFMVPDVNDGAPGATAVLLEGLATEDDAVGAIPPELVLYARMYGPKALHAWVLAHIAFEPEAVETFQSPAATLSYGYGDCDDSERMLVAIARAAGIPARLVYFLQDGQPAHVTAQLCDRGRWQWAETTIPARYGEHPFAALRRLGMARPDIGGTPYLLNGSTFVPLSPKVITMGGLPSSLGDSFASDLVALSANLGASPYDIAKLLLSESNLQPGAKNTRGFPAGQYAVGINQLAPVNWGYFAPMSASDYASLSADQQLPYAFKYFQNVMNGHGLTSISGRDLYWLNFLPAYFVPGATDAHVIVTSASPYYAPNKGLDHGGKGAITAGDLQFALDSQANPASPRYVSWWPDLAAAIEAAGGGLGGGNSGVASYGPSASVATALVLGVGALGYLLGDALS